MPRTLRSPVATRALALDGARMVTTLGTFLWSRCSRPFTHAWRGRMGDKGWAAWAARWRVPVGFGLGVAYLVFSRPTFRLLMVGGAVALLGLLLRAYAAGCLEKNRILAMGGPYAYTRNPLYLGSFILGMGFAVAGGSWALGAVLLSVFLLVYWPVMRREEDFLQRRFGDAYRRYREKVPLFILSGRRMPEAGPGFRWELYRRNREYAAALGYVGAIL